MVARWTGKGCKTMRANPYRWQSRNRQCLMQLTYILGHKAQNPLHRSRHIYRRKERFQVWIDTSAVVDVHQMNGPDFDAGPSQYPLLYSQVMQVVALDLRGGFHLNQRPGTIVSPRINKSSRKTLPPKPTSHRLGWRPF